MITLRQLLEQHPEWVDVPLKVYSEKNNGVVGASLHVEPMVYYYKPELGEEHFGDKDVECLVVSSGD